MASLVAYAGIDNKPDKPITMNERNRVSLLLLSTVVLLVMDGCWNWLRYEILVVPVALHSALGGIN